MVLKRSMELFKFPNSCNAFGSANSCVIYLIVRIWEWEVWTNVHQQMTMGYLRKFSNTVIQNKGNGFELDCLGRVCQLVLLHSFSFLLQFPQSEGCFL